MCNNIHSLVVHLMSENFHPRIQLAYSVAVAIDQGLLSLLAQGVHITRSTALLIVSVKIPAAMYICMYMYLQVMGVVSALSLKPSQLGLTLQQCSATRYFCGSSKWLLLPVSQCQTSKHTPYPFSRNTLQLPSSNGSTFVSDCIVHCSR